MALAQISFGTPRFTENFFANSKHLSNTIEDQMISHFEALKWKYKNKE